MLSVDLFESIQLIWSWANSVKTAQNSEPQAPSTTSSQDGDSNIRAKGQPEVTGCAVGVAPAPSIHVFGMETFK
jgi:hypothetical protein